MMRHNLACNAATTHTTLTGLSNVANGAAKHVTEMSAKLTQGHIYKTILSIGPWPHRLTEAYAVLTSSGRDFS
eukprot:4547034-Pleurochrysis_carterae.AAC.2